MITLQDITLAEERHKNLLYEAENERIIRQVLAKAARPKLLRQISHLVLTMNNWGRPGRAGQRMTS